MAQVNRSRSRRWRAKNRRPGNVPSVLTVNDFRGSDVVITMGCGDARPTCPGRRYEDSQLDDPAGQSITAVPSPIDDDIARIGYLIGELMPIETPNDSARRYAVISSHIA